MGIKHVMMVAIGCAALALTGCVKEKGVQAPLDTATEVSFQQSLVAAKKDMADDQYEMLNWALNRHTMATLHANYPNGTARVIVNGEADKMLAEKAAELAGAVAAYTKAEPILKEQEAKILEVTQNLQRISTQNVRLTLRKDSFFRDVEPQIEADVLNGSSYGITDVSWTAELYLDGGESPVATNTVWVSFSRQGGLDPGKRKKATLYLSGFSRAEAAWSTIAVQRAKERRVVLTLQPESVQDFNKRKLYPEFDEYRWMYERPIEKLKGEIESLNRAKEIINREDVKA